MSHVTSDIYFLFFARNRIFVVENLFLARLCSSILASGMKAHSLIPFPTGIVTPVMRGDPVASARDGTTPRRAGERTGRSAETKRARACYGPRRSSPGRPHVICLSASRIFLGGIRSVRLVSGPFWRPRGARAAGSPIREITRFAYTLLPLPILFVPLLTKILSPVDRVS
jgi:hypothetical protein